MEAPGRHVVPLPPFYDPEGNMLYVTEPHKVGVPAGAAAASA